MRKDRRGVVLSRVPEGIQDQVGVLGRLVRVVDASPRRDLAGSGPCIHALGITPLALLQRGVDEDFDEPIGADHLPHLVARGAIGADSGAYRDAAMPSDLRGYETDAADVGIA